jgi:mannose-6-phosphate isomerase
MNDHPSLMDLLPMKPHLRETVWGGRRLELTYARPLPKNKPIGESLELSAVPGQESVVAAGPLQGWTVSRLTETFGERLLGGRAWNRYGGKFPLLIKLIDAKEDLSVQVHPDDSYVRGNNLGDFGKAEAWYILSSQRGRVAHGFKRRVDAGKLRAAVEGGNAENLLNYISVREGDLVQTPPGTVHTICGGVMLYEIQQNSDLTFRLYDYGRTGFDGRPRDLHLDQALAVTNYDSGPAQVTRHGDESGPSKECLVEGEHFRLDLHRGAARFRAQSRFRVLTLVRGAAQLRGEETRFVLRPADTYLIPSGRRFAVTPLEEERLEYLLAAPA